MRRTLGMAGLTLALLSATITAPRAETPAVPEAAPPAANAPAPADRQRTGAAKLAGMIRFVAAFCPEAQPDYDRFRKVIAAMGVDIKDLEQGELMVESLRYSEAYKKDQAESCKRAFEHFGETGRTIPGLLARKAPESTPEKAPEPAPAKP